MFIVTFNQLTLFKHSQTGIPILFVILRLKEIFARVFMMLWYFYSAQKVPVAGGSII